MWPFKNRSPSNNLLQNKKLNTHSFSVQVFTVCFDFHGRLRILAVGHPLMGNTEVRFMVWLNIYFR